MIPCPTHRTLQVTPFIEHVGHSENNAPNNTYPMMPKGTAAMLGDSYKV